MKKGFRFWFMMVIAIVSLSLIVACGGDNNDNKDKTNANDNADNAVNDENNATAEKEDITIRWAHQWGEDHFWDGMGKYLSEEFPHITIEVQDAGTDHPGDLEDLIAGQRSPDIITLGVVTHIQFLEDLGLAYDMDELIAENDFDLDRLEPSIVEYTRKQDPNNEGLEGYEPGLYAIPTGRPTWSLHYNKDVFDKLGVDYPEDGMTWDETIELAKQLTREVDGVQYRGLDLDVPYDQFTQLNATSVDPDTGEVLVTQSEEWRRYVQMIDDVVSIPGNYPGDEPAALFHNWGSLFSQGEIAMAPAATHYGWIGTDNMDIATYPVWDKDDPVMPVPNTGGLAITDPAEHKEEILEIIDFLLSKEVQMENSRGGSLSILVDPEVQEVFAEEKLTFEGKNLDSLFMYPYATGPERSYKYSIPGLWTLPIDYVESGQDVNEFLRVFQEEGEEYLREQEATE